MGLTFVKGADLVGICDHLIYDQGPRKEEVPFRTNQSLATFFLPKVDIMMRVELLFLKG